MSNFYLVQFAPPPLGAADLLDAVRSNLQEINPPSMVPPRFACFYGAFHC